MWVKVNRAAAYETNNIFLQMYLGPYLVEKVHETAVGLHLVLQLVEDDEGGERKPSALWPNKNI